MYFVHDDVQTLSLGLPQLLHMRIAGVESETPSDLPRYQ